MIPELVKIFSRDLSKLQSEIGAFTNEDDIWKTVDHVKNSCGNLCLHLVGNLNNYIGKIFGQHRVHQGQGCRIFA